ncbi:MAG: hypothetical protein ACREFP_25545 [Acetobacteraceae bacterium]
MADAAKSSTTAPKGKRRDAVTRHAVVVEGAPAANAEAEAHWRYVEQLAAQRDRVLAGPAVAASEKEERRIAEAQEKARAAVGPDGRKIRTEVPVRLMKAPALPLSPGGDPKPYCLDDEQRARVRDCLSKAGLSLGPDDFKQFAQDIEASIDHLLGLPPEGAFRSAHDALRDLWQLSHADDPPIAQIRARIQKLPKKAIEYLDRSAPRVISRIFQTEPPITRFQQWSIDADGTKLVAATRVVSAEGAKAVQGRSRGDGRHSARRVEPVIMGETRGAGSDRHRGGRPTKEHYQTLVMYLAIDWLRATGSAPKSGRSDYGGFGDLVHSVFQWLGLDEGSAVYALRNYWNALQAVRPG